MLDRVLKFLTSLRLTVGLLCAAVLLVFVGTLAQVHEGLYDAQSRYFKSWFVWSPTIAHRTWLLVWQLATDMFQVESQMRLAEGQAKNYTESGSHYELAVVDKTGTQSDKVV